MPENLNAIGEYSIKRAYGILQGIEKDTLRVTTREAVLAEMVHVLSSRKLYNFSRKQIRDVLEVILSFSGLKLPHKNVYKRALKIYVSSPIDFTYALSLAHMERKNITEIVSFDEDFDRFPSIKRRTDLFRPQ